MTRPRPVAVLFAVQPIGHLPRLMAIAARLVRAGCQVHCYADTLLTEVRALQATRPALQSRLATAAGWERAVMDARDAVIDRMLALVPDR